jgi:hypothetical protein
MTDRSPLEGQLRECYARVAYTHKTHEKMAENCSNTLRKYKYAQIASSALTACGALTAVFVSATSVKIATVALSFASVWISGFMKNMDPGGTAQKHRDAAAALWPIRESYCSLLTDIQMKSISENDAIKKRDSLQKELAIIYKTSPQTNSKAYGKAQQALKSDEELTFSDQEIDHLLPVALRKRSNAETN